MGSDYRSSLSPGTPLHWTSQVVLLWPEWWGEEEKKGHSQNISNESSDLKFSVFLTHMPVQQGVLQFLSIAASRCQFFFIYMPTILPQYNLQFQNFRFLNEKQGSVGSQVITRVLEERVLRKIFGPKTESVTRCWKKFHNEELHDLHQLHGAVSFLRSHHCTPCKISG